jgi:uncharacterized protein (DUF885 family)
MSPEGGRVSADPAREFAALAEDYLDDLAQRHPGTATRLGDHRFDDRLPDDSAQARTAERAALDRLVSLAGRLALMTGRGFQEEGEAAGKWRRALLTSAQLSTYYVGYTEVSDLAGELTREGHSQRAVHDRMLAHGSPPVRLLRTVV